MKLIDSVSSDQLGELTADCGEAVLDSILNDGLLSEIPVFGALYKIVKAGSSVREQLFIKKTYNFLTQLSEIPITKRVQFIEQLNATDGLKQKVGESILIIIDRLDHIEKPKIIGRLLKARINEEIELEKFFRLSSIVDKAFIYDLHKLNNYQSKSIYEEDVSESLANIGLVYNSMIDAGGGSWIGEEDGSGAKYSITNLGKDLVRYGLE